MTVIAQEDARVFDTGGAQITGLASPSRGSSTLAAWRVRLKADHPSPEHSLSGEEVFIVLEGSVTARFGDREETASAGGALIVAPGEPFSLVARDAPAEAICMLGVGTQATVDGRSFTPPWAE